MGSLVPVGSTSWRISRVAGAPRSAALTRYANGFSGTLVDMDVSVESLCPPQEGTLTVYLGGRGYGESQVVVFPTGEVLVVDSCRDAGHVPLDLLVEFGLDRIDLLVV